MRDCNSARSIGELSPSKMQTKPLNLHTLSFNKRPDLASEMGAFQTPFSSVYPHLEACPRSRAVAIKPVDSICLLAEIVFYFWVLFPGNRVPKEHTDRHNAAPFWLSRAVSQVSQLRRICLATASRSRQSTVG